MPATRPLTADELAILRPYAGGAELATIADQRGIDRARLGRQLGDLCNLNRNAAREMVRTGVITTRTAAATMPPPTQHRTSGSNTPKPTLTRQQTNVLSLAAAGDDPTIIAVKLMVAVDTVRRHFNDAYTVLGVTNRADAIRVSLEQGLISRPATVATSAPEPADTATGPDTAEETPEPDATADPPADTEPAAPDDTGPAGDVDIHAVLAEAAAGFNYPDPARTAPAIITTPAELVPQERLITEYTSRRCATCPAVTPDDRHCGQPTTPVTVRILEPAGA